MRSWLPLALALLVLASLVVPTAAQQAGADPAPDPRVGELEISFMVGMIPHHRDAVAMAMMAEEKAIHPELRTMAQTIIDSQQGEIAKMSAFLNDWYGVQAPQGSQVPAEAMSQFEMPISAGLMPHMEAQMMELEQKSGADFEIAFLSAMSQHHALAVMMASPVLVSGHHEDLYKLANDIVLAQGEEIRQMQEWLKIWYGIPRPLR